MTTDTPRFGIKPRVFKPAPPRPPYKAAGVTAFQSFTEVVAENVVGLHIVDRTAAEFLLPVNSEDASLGHHARLALAASRFFQPGTPEWEDRPPRPTPEGVKADYERLMKLAKVRSRKALFADARHVSLELKDGTVTILPWKHVSSDHFTGLPGAVPLTLPATASDEELGRAIREGLSRSL